MLFDTFLTSLALDPEKRQVNLESLSQTLNEDEPTLNKFMERACKEKKIEENFEVASALIDLLSLLKEHKAAASNSLVPKLSQSPFKQVRQKIISKGLLPEEEALRILDSDQPNAIKLVLCARSEELYSFPYSSRVAKACDRVFKDKAQAWKLKLGADPLTIIKTATHWGQNLALAAQSLPTNTLEQILGIEGKVEWSWLQIYLTGIESPTEGPNAKVTSLLTRILNNPEIWSHQPSRNIKKALRYSFRKEGKLTIDAVSEPFKNPYLSFQEILVLSRSASWDNQITLFEKNKARLQDMGPAGLTKALEQIRPINKSQRSRHVKRLLTLIESLTSSQDRRIELFAKVFFSNKLPVGAATNYVLKEILGNSRNQAEEIFKIVASLLSSDQKPEKDVRKEGEPFVEYLSNIQRLSLFEALVEKCLSLYNTSDWNYLFATFYRNCTDLSCLRSATVVYVGIMEEAEVMSSVLLCPVVTRMEGIAKPADKLPFEILQYLRDGSSPEARILLEQVQDEKTSLRLIQEHGKETWWRLVSYGLGNQPFYGHQIGAPKPPALLKSDSKKKIRKLSPQRSSHKEKDMDFQRQIKLVCSTRDIFSRRDILIEILQSAGFSSSMFRTDRLVSLIELIKKEPPVVKNKVLPLLVEKVRDAQTFVSLTTELKDLFRVLRQEKVVYNWVPLATLVMKKVLALQIPLSSEPALLARQLLLSDPGAYQQYMYHEIDLTRWEKVGAFLLEGLVTSVETQCAVTGKPLLEHFFRLCDALEMAPQDLEQKPWAHSLVQALKDQEDIKYTLVEAQDVTNRQKWDSYIAVDASMVDKALKLVKQLPSPAALGILSRRLEALFYSKRFKKENVDPKTTLGINQVVQLIITILKGARSDERKECESILFERQFDTWNKYLDHEQSFSLFFYLVLTWRLSLLDQPKSDTTNTLGICVDVLVKSSHTCGRLGLTLNALASLPNAMHIFTLSGEFREHLISTRQSLLRKIISSHLEKKSGSTSTTVPNTLCVKFAAALNSSLSSGTNSFRQKTAELVAEFLRPGMRLSEPEVLECAAYFLRHVDLIEPIVRGMEGLETYAQTKVLRAAAASGHSVRTVRLCTNATSLSDTSHREIFERAIAALPHKKAQEVVQRTLAKSGVAVTKRLLNLVISLSFPNPTGILIDIWKKGKCHTDVRVCIMKHLASMESKLNPEAFKSDIHDIFNPTFEGTDKDTLSSICQELTKTKLQLSVSSMLVLEFIFQSIQLGGIIANDAFTYLVGVLSFSAEMHADSKSEYKMPRTESERLLQILCSMLSGASSLVAVRAEKNLKCNWDGVRWYKLVSIPELAEALSKTCSHESVRGFVQTLAVQKTILSSKQEKASTVALYSLWAKALLRPTDSEATTNASIKFALQLSARKEDMLTALRRAAVARVSDPTVGMSDTVTLACQRVVQEVFRILGGKENLIKDLSTIAATKLIISEEISDEKASSKRMQSFQKVLDMAAQFDQEKEETHFTELALEVCDTEATKLPPLPLLDWVVKEEKLTETTGGVQVAKKLAKRVLQNTQYLETKAKRKIISEVIELVFPLHHAMKNFPDILSSYDEEAVVVWVQRFVVAIQKTEPPLQKLTIFSKSVQRIAKAALLRSEVPCFRIQALTFLDKSALVQISKEDPDVGVRVYAASLLAQ